MKNRFLAMALAVFALAACSKEEDVLKNNNEFNEITLTVGNTDMIKSKANPKFVDGIPTGYNLRYIVQVYSEVTGSAFGLKQDALVIRTGTDTDGDGVKFTLRVPKNAAYRVAAWADFVTDSDASDGIDDKWYNTSDLKAITVNSANAAAYYLRDVNTLDNSRDAYSNMISCAAGANSNISMELTRPFAQINVRTLDLSYIQPVSVKLTYPNLSSYAFNIYTQAAATTPAGNVTFSLDLKSGNNLMFSNLVFTDVKNDPISTELVNFNLDFHSAAVASQASGNLISSYNFTNIPARRNYRTNISGNLLTNSIDLTITIDQNFNDPDYNVTPEGTVIP